MVLCIVTTSDLCGGIGVPSFMCAYVCFHWQGVVKVSVCRLIVSQYQFEGTMPTVACIVCLISKFDVVCCLRRERLYNSGSCIMHLQHSCAWQHFRLAAYSARVWHSGKQQLLQPPAPSGYCVHPCFVYIASR